MRVEERVCGVRVEESEGRGEGVWSEGGEGVWSEGREVCGVRVERCVE